MSLSFYKFLAIPRRSRECGCACGHKLVAGDEVISFLADTPQREYQRFDFCIQCHEGNKTCELAKHAIGYWKHQIKKKEEEEVEIKKSMIERAESLVLTMKDSVEKVHQQLVFFLILFLERKRKVRLIKKIEEGSTLFWKCYLVFQEEELMVQAFKFDAQEMKELNRKFQLLLENQQGSETVLVA